MSRGSRNPGRRVSRGSRNPGSRPGPTRAREQRRRRLPGLRAMRLMLAVSACAALGVGGFVWLRSSALVAIEHVRIVGVSGPGSAQIIDALRRSALGMTTLDADPARYALPCVRTLPSGRCH